MRLYSFTSLGLTPLPHNQSVIQFHPRFYVDLENDNNGGGTRSRSSKNDQNDGVVILDSYSSITYSESMWYASIESCWRLLLPHLIAAGRTKYSLEAL